MTDYTLQILIVSSRSMRLRPLRNPISMALRVATAASFALGMFGSMFLAADEPGMPKSLDQAIAMERADALPRTAFYDTPSLASSKPGNLLRQEPGIGFALPSGASAVRILYHSLDADGADVATSGVVLIPAGGAPADGWPVIVWAHGTSGVARQCAPSLQKDMEYGEEGLMPMVRAGFAVIATDYRGLGTQGPHEYLNKTAQGRDVIYSIPAAHAAVPSLARGWVVIGHSQGGLAAWSVAEMQVKLHDPNYLGTISVAPAADLRSIIANMGEPRSSAVFYLPYMAYGMQVRTPSFKPSDMLMGEALQRYTDVTTKGCWNYAYGAFIGAPSGPVLKPDWDRLPAAARFFAEATFGETPVAGPLLVIAGIADESVPFAPLRAIAVKACRNGSALTFRSYPGLDHDPLMDKSTPDQLAWVRDRLAGKPVPSNCATLVK